MGLPNRKGSSSESACSAAFLAVSTARWVVDAVRLDVVIAVFCYFF